MLPPGRRNSARRRVSFGRWGRRNSARQPKRSTAGRRKSAPRRTSMRPGESEAVMPTKKTNHRYHSTESKYKGGAQEMYVTYDEKQKTRGGDEKLYPKVKRVYIAGEVKDWKVGSVRKRTGRKVHGVEIQY